MKKLVLEMPTFQALGLVALSPIMMDALRWAKTYIENTPLFSFAVAQTFKMWEEALELKASPSAMDLATLVGKCQGLTIQVRFADWTGANKYGDSLIGTIWISPVLVAAAEETKSAKLVDLIRSKMMHEYWHQLTPYFSELCALLDATKPSPTGTPLLVGMKAYNLGDNGYAWEEAILGGRLFVKGSPGTWTTPAPLILHIRAGDTDQFTKHEVDSNRWTTTGGESGLPAALKIKTFVAAKRARAPSQPGVRQSSRQAASRKGADGTDDQLEVVRTEIEIDEEEMDSSSAFSFDDLPAWHPDLEENTHGRKA